MDSVYHTDESEHKIDPREEAVLTIPSQHLVSTDPSHNSAQSTRSRECMSLRESEHRISTLRLNETEQNSSRPWRQSSVASNLRKSSISHRDDEAPVTVVSDVVNDNCCGHVVNDSRGSAKTDQTGQKTVTLSDRNLSCEAGKSCAVIKNYLRQLAAVETSVLGQVVR